MIPSTVIGKYTGNGAAQNVIIGFQPDALIVVNVTDATLVGLWFRSASAAGTSIDIAAAAAPNAADGFTAYAGTAGQGFTVGTDYSVNAKVYSYIALRSGPGAS